MLKNFTKPPKTTHHHKLIILSGDIETNPGPMPNIFINHPKKHKRLAKIYFIKNTIKLQPEYMHLAKTYAPFFTTTHPTHIEHSTNYPHIHQYIQQILPQNPPSHIIYALITTLHPHLNKYNDHYQLRNQNEETD